MYDEADKYVIRGDSENFTITFTDSDGNGVDITGWTVWFTVRDSIPSTSVVDDTDAIISIKNTTHTNPTGGQTLIEISDTDNDIDPKTYYYDIQYKKLDGSVKSIGHRKYIIHEDITRGTT